MLFFLFLEGQGPDRIPGELRVWGYREGKENLLRVKPRSSKRSQIQTVHRAKPYLPSHVPISLCNASPAFGQWILLGCLQEKVEPISPPYYFSLSVYFSRLSPFPFSLLLSEDLVLPQALLDLDTLVRLLSDPQHFSCITLNQTFLLP